MPVGPGQFVKDGATLQQFIREIVFKQCGKSFAFRDETVRPFDKADIDAAMHPIGVPLYSQKIRSGFNVLDSRGRSLTDLQSYEADLNTTTYILTGVDLERFLMFNEFENGFASGRWRESEEFACCVQLIVQHREKTKICHVYTVVALVNDTGEVNLPSFVDGDAGFRSATRYSLTVARRAGRH